ncbi:TauD/TfdA family dioxygenase [Methylocella sp. CPCC 101449]|jgi:taurine dioxygenase|uniref:TauD/TfdA dioxygenase family protein n=1 Tax=Methylocella sp. CPCC 101449 TaxID=2987531 RepID=UPI002890226B|nr:TauD/TfdA family dioxygenase [Methylocella sp. CPCC 101449]MDT2019371.1 TauD/TfdA family dioxygenase [Methylocella sp. CPCC 101449]HEV2573230.1 TauD/TfdA family dioxygenase [Beijerinckiaceae bacterium]
MANLDIEHLTPAIGSVIHGIDLADKAAIDRYGEELRRVFVERQVIFFRDQKLDPHAQVAFSRLFGDVRPVSSTFPSHPDNPHLEILQSKGTRTGTDVWHADLTWQKDPPIGACLYAVNVPPAGGDTMWASMTAAYDALDEKFRAYIDDMTAIHDWEGPELMAGVRASPDAQQRYNDMRKRFPPIEQPVVKVHPESGRRLIYVNTLYTTRIVGVTRAESSALTNFLSGLSSVPEWQVRFRWQPGSVAVWDNRAVQHYAVNDYHPYPRLMHRVTVY